MTAAATATATEANTTGTSTRLSESPSLLASSRATSAASSWLHELAVSFVRALFRQFVFFFRAAAHTHTHWFARLLTCPADSVAVEPPISTGRALSPLSLYICGFRSRLTLRCMKAANQQQQQELNVMCACVLCTCACAYVCVL